MVTCYSFIKSSCTDTFHILMRSSDAVEEHFGVLGCLLLLLKGLEITNGISLCSCVILHHYTYLCVLLMNFNILCSPLSVVFCHLFFSLQDGRCVDIRSRLMPLYQGSWMSILREGERKVIACGFSTMESVLPKDIQPRWHSSSALQPFLLFSRNIFRLTQLLSWKFFSVSEITRTDKNCR